MSARRRRIIWDNPPGGWTIEEEDGYMTHYEGRGLMTVSDAAEVLDVNRATLYRWIIDGEIRAVTVSGGEYQIPNSEVKRLLQ